MAVADKLLAVNQVKQDIKEAIENKDIDLTGIAFSGYAEKIDDIVTGGGASGGYKVTINNQHAYFAGWLLVQQANGSEFTGEFKQTSIIENVIYIKHNTSMGGKFRYTGITWEEAEAGKTLTNDIEILVRD